MTVSMKMTGTILTNQVLSNSILLDEALSTSEQIAKQGVERLQQLLQPRPAGVLLSIEQAGKTRVSGARGATYASTIHAIRSNLNVTILDNNAVYGPWLEGTGSRNDTTRFKGYASFRKTEQWLQDTVAPSLTVIAERNIAKRLES